jgi:hypothetical protein
MCWCDDQLALCSTISLRQTSDCVRQGTIAKNKSSSVATNNMPPQVVQGVCWCSDRLALHCAIRGDYESQTINYQVSGKYSILVCYQWQ